MSVSIRAREQAFDYTNPAPRPGCQLLSAARLAQRELILTVDQREPYLSVRALVVTWGLVLVVGR
jgi:hypothetical protein